MNAHQPPQPPRQPTPAPQVADWTCWRDPAHHVDVRPSLGWPQCTVCGAAPAYHKRPAYLPGGFLLTVYVPAKGWATRSDPIGQIAARSAIVGIPDDPTVYFEGWTHGPAQYGDRDAHGLWEAGIEHASSRLVTAYPTTAIVHLGGARADALRRVGSYDPRRRSLDVTDEAAVTWWLAQD